MIKEKLPIALIAKISRLSEEVIRGLTQQIKSISYVLCKQK